MPSRGRLIALILLSTVLVVLVLWLLRVSGFDQQILTFLQSLENAGLRGYTLFGLAVIVAVLTLLPSVMLTLGAGFLFGLGWGSLTMVVAETIAATLAFLIARWCMSERLRYRIRKHPAVAAVESVMQAEGWQFIVLLRLIPFFPYKLSNYALGMSSVSLYNYVLGTAIGIVPITVFNVYIGSIASDVLSIGKNTGPQSLSGWLSYGASFALLGAAIIYLGRRASQRFNEIRQDS